jgi:hypothetical protein
MGIRFDRVGMKVAMSANIPIASPRESAQVCLLDPGAGPGAEDRTDVAGAWR